MSNHYPTPLSIAGSFEEPNQKRRRSGSATGLGERSHTDHELIVQLLLESKQSKDSGPNSSPVQTAASQLNATAELTSMEQDLLVWGYMLCQSKKSLSFLLSKESRCGKSKKASSFVDESKALTDGIKLKDYNGDNIASSGYLLGKDAECDVVLSSPEISERHCVIFKIHSSVPSLGPEGPMIRQLVYLQDISGRGTYINSTLVRQNEVRLLKDNDRIALTSDSPVWIYKAPHTVLHRSFSQRFATGRTIGRGHFAEVHEVIDKLTKQKYAAKIIKKKMVTEDKTFLQEIGLLMSCTHPLITCIRDVFDTDTEMFLILELAAGGELFDRIIQKGRFTEDETRFLFRQLFSALQYLHEHNIVHRDIKPENILLTAPESLEIRLADFGLAKIIDEKSVTTTLAGTPSYIPPEMLGNPSGGRSLSYSHKVDSWSAGVVLYICLCGFPPFSQELAPPPLKTQIKEGLYQFQRPYWDSVSDEAIDLVRHLLTVDPQTRYSVADALKHPFMLRTEGGTNHTPIKSNHVGQAQRGPKRQRTMISQIGRKAFVD